MHQAEEPAVIWANMLIQRGRTLEDTVGDRRCPGVQVCRNGVVSYLDLRIRWSSRIRSCFSVSELREAFGRFRFGMRNLGNVEHAS